MEKKTIAEIIRESREEDRFLTLEEFELCIHTVRHHLRMARFINGASRIARDHYKKAEYIVSVVQERFKDKENNLLRWFRREPCVIARTLGGQDTEVLVDEIIESIYHVLELCFKINSNDIPDEELDGFLSHYAVHSTDN